MYNKKKKPTTFMVLTQKAKKSRQIKYFSEIRIKKSTWYTLLKTS